MQKNELSDETQIFQFGYSEDRNFYSFFSKVPEASAWNNFPTEKNPLSRYKFSSIEVNFSADQQRVNRQTYSLLDWLGDMGGLLDALYLIGMMIMSPFAEWALKTELLSSIFRFRGSEEALKLRTKSRKRLDFIRNFFSMKNLEDKHILSSLKNDFHLMKPIKKISCFRSFMCCRQNYRKMILKSQSSLTKELDLRKFIYRQRLQTTAILGLLSGS